ncbi:hypothetical protein [Deferribacter abyssi]|uniref:hypothetical protein n=1 Tax=Deferribacter abyssi TaxID=213806 RepID=UPI003C235D43
MKVSSKNILIIALAIILSISCYFLLKALYLINVDFPYSQEILAALIGTLITIFITAILLNKQTEVELLKEENLKILELKVSIYNELFKYLEEIFLKQDLNKKDIIKLKLINQKLSMVASHDVLRVFGKFIDEFNEASLDKKILEHDVDDILNIVSELSNSIRYDLLEGKRIEKQSEKAAILKQILRNTEMLEKNKI